MSFSTAGDQSAQFLQLMLRNSYPGQFKVFANAFALGCLLHLQGERCAGFKLIAQVFGVVDDLRAQGHLDALLHDLSGNEVYYVQAINPSAEVAELCDRLGRVSGREAACAR